jgi:hypothetical protein
MLMNSIVRGNRMLSQIQPRTSSTKPAINKIEQWETRVSGQQEIGCHHSRPKPRLRALNFIRTQPLLPISALLMTWSL